MANEKGQAFANIASGLGSLGGVASTVAGIIGSIGQQKRQKDLMDYQYQKNLDLYKQQFGDQWQMYERQLADQRQLIQEERDYNDFSSVAARARAAGVNPLAIFGNGGVGIQSASGSTPNSSVPSAGSVSIPGADNIGGNLIAAGSTINNIVRQSALLNAEMRSAEAEAKLKELDVIWRDKQYTQDYETKEFYKEMARIGVGDSQSRARLTTAMADLAELNLSTEEQIAPEKISQMQTATNTAIATLDAIKVDNEYQRDFKVATLDRINAEIDSMRTNAMANWRNALTNEFSAEVANKQYGLNREQYVALEQYRKEQIRLEEQDQKLREKIERNRNTKDYTIRAADWINERAKIKAQMASNEQRLQGVVSSAVLNFLFKNL